MAIRVLGTRIRHVPRKKEPRGMIFQRFRIGKVENYTGILVPYPYGYWVHSKAQVEIRLTRVVRFGRVVDISYSYVM